MSTLTRIPVISPERHLCAKCSQITQILWDRTKASKDHGESGGNVRRGWEAAIRVPHHSTLNDMIEAVEQGCMICCTVWHGKQLEPLVAGNQITRSQQFGLKCVAWHNKHYTISKLLFTTICDIIPDKSEFELCFESESELAGAHNLDHQNFEGCLVRSSSSSASFAATKTWLRHCESSHDLCSKWRKSNFMPTRVINVQHETDHVRLQLEADPQQHYVALSHCWGASLNCLKTLKGNIAAFEKGIEISELPKNFVDAIQICRQLGIRYLWIDALCIVQDDPSDWHRESLMMSKVYRNAYFTIAVSDSTNVQGGCFFPVLRTLICPFEVNDWRAHDGSPLFGFQNINYKNHVAGSPLYARSWTFQERLMSVRILHFTRRGIVYECRTNLSSEGFPYGLPQAISEYNSMQFRYLKQMLWDHEEATDRLAKQSESLSVYREATQGAWFGAVTAYSQCKLTYLSDKFIALSAITQGLEPIFGEFVAGHWSSLWPFDLLWTTQEEYASREIRRHLAPSWSWASIEGPIFIISMPFDTYRQHGDSTSDVYTATFGHFDFSNLDKLKPWSCDKISLHFRTKLFTLHVEGDDAPITSKPSRLPRKFDIHFKETDEDVLFDPMYDLPPAEGTGFPTAKLYCALLINDSITCDAYGLLLSPLDDGTYERIGIFHIKPPFIPMELRKQHGDQVVENFLSYLDTVPEIIVVIR